MAIESYCPVLIITEGNYIPTRWSSRAPNLFITVVFPNAMLLILVSIADKFVCVKISVARYFNRLLLLYIYIYFFFDYIDIGCAQKLHDHDGDTS